MGEVVGVAHGNAVPCQVVLTVLKAADRQALAVSKARPVGFDVHHAGCNADDVAVVSGRRLGVLDVMAVDDGLRLRGLERALCGRLMRGAFLLGLFALGGGLAAALSTGLHRAEIVGGSLGMGGGEGQGDQRGQDGLGESRLLDGWAMARHGGLLP